MAKQDKLLAVQHPIVIDEFLTHEKSQRRVPGTFPSPHKFAYKQLRGHNKKGTTGQNGKGAGVNNGIDPEEFSRLIALVVSWLSIKLSRLSKYRSAFWWQGPPWYEMPWLIFRRLRLTFQSSLWSRYLYFSRRYGGVAASQPRTAR